MQEMKYFSLIIMSLAPISGVIEQIDKHNSAAACWAFVCVIYAWAYCWALFFRNPNK
jgi:hypothetical protein